MSGEREEYLVKSCADCVFVGLFEVETFCFPANSLSKIIEQSDTQAAARRETSGLTIVLWMAPFTSQQGTMRGNLNPPRLLWLFEGSGGEKKGEQPSLW
jgi:hypothetical protein